MGQNCRPAAALTPRPGRGRRDHHLQQDGGRVAAPQASAPARGRSTARGGGRGISKGPSRGGPRSVPRNSREKDIVDGGANRSGEKPAMGPRAGRLHFKKI